jgi:hypothetical protein
VYHVGRLGLADHCQVAQQGVEQLGVPRVLSGKAQRRRDAAHTKVAAYLVLVAETEHVHAMRAALGARQLP